jgi:hypothetical protein
MNDTTIAADAAKNVFEIGISEEAGKVTQQLRVSRSAAVVFCETAFGEHRSRGLRVLSSLGRDLSHPVQRSNHASDVRRRTGPGSARTVMP